ncbi:MAG: 4-(cytidine 5'-diphospho)-2-C-methyl-D-erythritol kinase [Synechococcus sp. H1_metabat_bins_2.tsv.006]|nr:4-(cytidine 5'-diphospho)-2-C-methyl-D-erythritol kinase [Synechococcus sp. H1_metabat_bins_2.tsv.006]
MSSLSLRAPAKINLHLEVLGLRDDGFHELSMVMQTLDLADDLTVESAPAGQVVLHCSDPQLPVDGSNLIVKAAELLRRHCGRPELSAQLSLSKCIPIGAGLAGGSSDGATALLLLNRYWELQLSAAELQALAAQLGSDVAFCLQGGTQLCFGRGERLEPIQRVAQPAVLLIKNPKVSVSTPWAYGLCKERLGSSYLNSEVDFEGRRQALRQSPLVGWLQGEQPQLPPLRNDLQQVVAPENDSVQKGLALLASAGDPLQVAMSGSGPSLFALYRDQPAAAAAQSALAPALAENGFEHWICQFTAERHG